MIRAILAGKVQSAIGSLIESGKLPRIESGFPLPEIQDTKLPEHGDLATNWAMTALKHVAQAGNGETTNPRALGELLADALRIDPDIERVEVAGPGFVNVFFAPKLFRHLVQRVRQSSDKYVLDDESHFARPELSSDKQRLKINLEYVSVNPNGPITIGSGRGAAYGSTLANVIIASGHTVHREYYINDGVNSEQMRLFAESVKAICEGLPVPDNGYKGDYVYAVASEIDKEGSGVETPPLEVRTLAWYQDASQDLMIAKQQKDLAAFGVGFDTWFSEQSLHLSGKVDEKVKKLIEDGAADEGPYRTKLKLVKGGVIESVEREPQSAIKDDEDLADSDVSDKAGEENTLWLRSALFGDDMDRVLRRRDGRLTYIASDVAYHDDKFNRPPGADKLITVLGPDHHGYIGRLHAVVAADLVSRGGATRPDDGDARSWASDAERDLFQGDLDLRDRCQSAVKRSYEVLEVLIFQLVRFLKDGKPAPMRKRDGNIFALIDLITDIGERVKPNGTLEEKLSAGRDVARFFYLMRHHDTTFDFDLDLAAKQSDENPVFYVQYAHARVSSVIEKARSLGLTLELPFVEDSAVPLHPKERSLILKILDLPYEVERCSLDYSVNRLTTYAVELARTYHAFYEPCRVIDMDNLETTAWRLRLCQATRIALRAVFDLLGISAPDRMDRDLGEIAN